jgi:hypothetical protein
MLLLGLLDTDLGWKNIDRIDMVDRNIILSDWADLGLIALIQRDID